MEMGGKGNAECDKMPLKAQYIAQCTIVLHPLTQKLTTMVQDAVKRIGNNRTEMVY